MSLLFAVDALAGSVESFVAIIVIVAFGRAATAQLGGHPESHR